MLTDKQRKYAHARVAGQNMRDAAITAGSTETSAKTTATRWEKNPEVQALMLELGFTPRAAVTATPLPPAAVAEDDPVIPLDEYDDPVEYMKAVVNCPTEDPKLRLDAAKAWDASNRAKVAAKGKKEEKADKAKEAANRFAAPAPPKLAAVK